MNYKYTFNPNRTTHTGPNKAKQVHPPLNTYERFGIGITIGCGILVTVYTAVLLLWALMQ
ncbi:hypothetical protein KAR91_51695 [Candidatus Pacearchaeota archaeon]|nr:hypothetical protein [Candidatus Pacearchaeota archaeon]